MPADIMFTGRLIVSLLDPIDEVLSLTVELDGAMPTAAALELLHPVERVAVETWGVEQRFLTVEVFDGDLRACSKQLRVGHTISGHGRHVDLIRGFTTRYQFHLVADPADLSA